MSVTPAETIAAYNKTADALLEQYKAMSRPNDMPWWFGFLPPIPSDVLDVGAGFGFAVVRLAKAGHRPIAVEPSQEMWRLGTELRSDHTILYVEDRLPDLTRVKALEKSFPFILCNAVWMHMPPSERTKGMASFTQLLAPSGVLALSLRHGPPPPDRPMYAIDADETIAAAQEAGLANIHNEPREDTAKRPGVSWTMLAFRHKN